MVYRVMVSAHRGVEGPYFVDAPRPSLVKAKVEAAFGPYPPWALMMSLVAGELPAGSVVL